MSEPSKRSTIYFEPEVHKALRLKAASTHRSVSDLVNEAVRQALQEDQEDLAAFDERVAEPTMTYNSILKFSSLDNDPLGSVVKDLVMRWPYISAMVLVPASPYRG